MFTDLWWKIEHFPHNHYTCFVSRKKQISHVEFLFEIIIERRWWIWWWENVQKKHCIDGIFHHFHLWIREKKLTMVSVCVFRIWLLCLFAHYALFKWSNETMVIWHLFFFSLIILTSSLIFYLHVIVIYHSLTFFFIEGKQKKYIQSRWTTMKWPESIDYCKVRSI